MGKYSQVLSNLEVLPPENPKYQDKVDVRKRELAESIGELTPTNLARVYEQLREQKEALKEQLEVLQLDLTSVEQMLVDSYEASGTSSVKLENGTSVGVQCEPMGQVLDKQVFRMWCIHNGLEEQMTLPWQTMNSIVKERLLAGQNPPDGCGAFLRNKIVKRG